VPLGVLDVLEAKKDGRLKKRPEEAVLEDAAAAAVLWALGVSWSAMVH
jgi:hypothetical protein